MLLARSAREPKRVAKARGFKYDKKEEGGFAVGQQATGLDSVINLAFTAARPHT